MGAMMMWQVEFKGSRLELKPTPELGSSKNKMLHVVYRVGNMDRAIKFYQDVFGMEVRGPYVTLSRPFTSPQYYSWEGAMF